jgi:hypothetical protein
MLYIYKSNINILRLKVSNILHKGFGNYSFFLMKMVTLLDELTLLNNSGKQTT